MASFQHYGVRFPVSWFTVPVLLASIALAAFCSGAQPANANAPTIGINIQNVADWNGDLLFADAMKEARDWNSSPGGTLLTMTSEENSNGWPLEDADIVVYAGCPNNMGGTYALSFNGEATVAAASGTIANKSYNSTSNTTTATLTEPSGNTYEQLTFTNTQQNSGSATDTGITNVELMRPTTEGGTSSYASGTLFTTSMKNFLGLFNAIRFMDYVATNSNQQVNWSDRFNAFYASANVSAPSGYGWEGRGGAWEYAIQLCNQTSKDMWLNVPEAASEDYITKLAQMVAYGSDGNLPYTSPQGSPVYAPLNSNLHCYVEFSNEVWNTAGAFQQSTMNYNSAGSEGAPLNFDGDTSQWDWAARRTAQRTVDISNVFRSIFGNAAMMTRIRPVLESQEGYTTFWALQQTHMLQDYFNNSSRVSNPEPPSYYIYGGGGSAYYNPNNTDTSMTLNGSDPIWTSSTFVPATWAPTCTGEVDYAVPNYGRREAYEGGPSMDSCSCAADTIKAEAWSDSRMTGIVTANQTQYNQSGGDMIMYFNSVGNYEWGFTNDPAVLTTPKCTAISDIDSSTQAVGTYGVAIPSTITASNYVSPATWAGTSLTNMTPSASWSWAGYSVCSSSASAFNIALSAGSSGTSNQAAVYMDGQLVGTITVPNTGSNTTYQTTSAVTTVTLPAGTHGILVKSYAGSFGFQSIIVTTASGSAPAAPTGLTAAAGNTQVALSWSSSSGATSYSIYRGTTSGGEAGTAIATGVTSVTYTNTGLTNGTTYYYEVAALNSYGTSGKSNEASATPTGPPSAPTGLSAAAGGGQISLSWNSSSTATSYNVLRATTSGGESLLASGVSTTAYTDTGLIAGKTYYYEVTAVNGAGTSSASSQVSAVPQAATLPIQINAGGPAVSPFVADTDYVGGTPYTNWTGAIVTTGLTNPAPQAVYQAERYSSPAMTYTISGLAAGTTYTVRLHLCENYFTTSGSRVFDVSINGTQVLTNFDIFATTGAAHTATIQQFAEPANSSGAFVISFTNVTNNALIDGIEVVSAGGSAPAAPTGLTAAAGNAQVALTWNASTGATSYNVLRSTTSGSGYAQVTNVTTTSYTNTGLTNGTTYFFVVAAVNAYGTSANSSQASATPIAPPAAPTGLTAAAGNAQVGLTWNASTGATSYNVLRSTVSGSGYAQVTNVTTTSYTNTGLTNGTTYYFVVAALNSSGTSANSSQVSAVPTTVSPPATPGTPQLVSASAQVGLTWASSTGATSYSVYRGTTSGGESSTAIFSGNAVQYLDTGRTNGTTYYYTVKAVNSGGSSAATPEVSATPMGATGLPIQINCGGPAVSPFVADTDFSGGTPYTNWTGAITTTAVTDPAPQGVYQPERYGAMTYTIPGLTVGSTYIVRLHFCENYFTTSGSRVFDVSINSTSVLSNFDIYATAGAAHTAVIEQFTEAANSSGQMVIVFTNVTNNALVNGIEIYAQDNSSDNFEGSADSWAGFATPITAAAPSYTEAYSGLESLAVTFNGAAGTSQVEISSPSTTAGEVVTYRVWIPSSNSISAVQAFVQQGSGGGYTWTGDYQPISNLATNAWNTFQLTVPSNAVTPLMSLGVAFTTSATWTGACYVDSVNW